MSVIEKWPLGVFDISVACKKWYNRSLIDVGQGCSDNQKLSCMLQQKSVKCYILACIKISISKKLCARTIQHIQMSESSGMDSYLLISSKLIYSNKTVSQKAYKTIFKSLDN